MRKIMKTMLLSLLLTGLISTVAEAAIPRPGRNRTVKPGVKIGRRFSNDKGERRCSPEGGPCHGGEIPR